MGYIRHHAIAVTSFDKKLIQEANIKAVEVFGSLTTPIIESHINGYQTFFVAPDGSKEGWEDSDNGDLKREEFINWMDKQAYKDESNALSFCEFFYGDDEGKSKVENHN
jgi:hypothetical protein